MKWAALVLAILFPVVLLAAEGHAPLGIQRVLTNAVVGERQAIARYNAFAVKADEEGYPGAASLFRACAKAESTSARRATTCRAPSARRPRSATARICTPSAPRTTITTRAWPRRSMRRAT